MAVCVREDGSVYAAPILALAILAANGDSWVEALVSYGCTSIIEVSELWDAACIGQTTHYEEEREAWAAEGVAFGNPSDQEAEQAIRKAAQEWERLGRKPWPSSRKA
jgi:hypothetical protein